MELIYPEGFDLDEYVYPNSMIYTCVRGTYIICNKYIITPETLDQYKDQLLEEFNLEIRWRNEK